MDSSGRLWSPSPAAVREAALTAFATDASARAGRPLASYADLHRWSVEDRGAFWSLVWEFLRRHRREGRPRRLVDGDRMPGAASSRMPGSISPRTCSGKPAPSDAIVFRGEDKVERRLSWDELARAGVAPAAGDARRSASGRATASLRCCRTCPKRSPACSRPPRSARSGRPARRISASEACSTASARSSRVLFIACDGYWYNGKQIDVAAKVRPCWRSCRASGRRSSWPISAPPRRRSTAMPRAVDPRRAIAPYAASAADVRAAAVRAPALHPLLVRHDRRAEMHRALRRRHAAPAPQGAPAALPDLRRATGSSTSPPAAG